MTMNKSYNILNKVRKYIAANNLFDQGDRVVVGLSGGADSVCLLHILQRLSPELDIDLCAAHLNHGLRGEESERDSDFTVSLCDRMGIRLFIKKIDIAALAKEQKISEETAGRNARYAFFNKVKQQFDANKIAIAHNLNDNAETVVMHFLRGSGVGGLAGIAPKRKDGVVRPVLGCSRSEIEQYCEINRLDYVTDSTNLSPCYHRNSIRLELMEVLKRYNPNIAETLAANAEIMRYDSDYLQRQAQALAEEILIIDDVRITAETERLLGLHPAMQSRILKIGVERLSGSHTDIPAAGIDRVLELIRSGKTGQREDICKGILAERTAEGIVITDKPDKAVQFCYPLSIDSELAVPETGHVFLAQIVDKPGKNSKECVFFDYNLIKGQIYIRCKKNGDWFRPAGLGGSKKLKDYFIDSKIPAPTRAQIPILATDSAVLWVCGYRADERFLATEQSEQILMIKFQMKKG